MVSFFLHIYDFLQQRRRLCLGLLFALTGLLVLMTASLKYNENIFDFLPMSAKQQKAIALYQDVSGGQRIVAMFRMKDGDSTRTDRLAEAVDTFASRLQQGDGSRHVQGLMTQVDFEKVSAVTDFVYSHIPLLLADSDYVRMERLLSAPGYVADQLETDVQLVMMPAAGFFANSISHDPLALFAPVMERLQRRQTAMPFDMDDGYIYTADHRYALAMLTSPYGAMESADNGRLVSYVDSVTEQTMRDLPDVDVAVTGSPVIAVGNAQQIRTDSQWAITIAVTLILLLLVFSFHNVRNLLLIGLSIVFGWLFAMGFIAVVRSDVSLIVLGIGSIIIGIAVNYPLHFIAHTDHGGTTREVLKDMVAPLLIGNITTVGAFASLMPLDAPALRDLGLFAAFMLVGTILFVLVFLPHLVKRREQRAEERLLFGRVSSLSPDRHRWLLCLIAALTLLLGYFSLGTSFDANMHHVNYMTPTQERLLADLHASAGINDTSNVYLVTEGDTWDEALDARARLAPLVDSLSRAGRVKRYSDVTAMVASAAEQQRRIDRWQAFWATHRDAVVGQLRQQAPVHGFSSDAFDAFYALLSADYATQSFDHFAPLRDVLLSSSFSTVTGRKSVVDVVDVGSSDVFDVERLLDTAAGSSGYAFDFVGMNSAVAESLSADFNYIGFACGFIVFLFLWLSFGRLELSLLAFIPMAVGWVWILGIMYLCGMQFNIVNVILATFIFGQGDDYTIFMTDGLMNEFAYRKKLLPSYKNSIVISALIMFIGMGSLIVARHPALYSLAEVTIVGMFTVVLMAWIVPPLIFGWLVRTDGRTRLVPVTVEQVVRTVYCTVCYLLELTYGCVAGVVLWLLPVGRERRERWIRVIVHRTMRADVRHIWGVKAVVRNDHGEDFSRGSIMVCNHQSMLDPIYLLALHPRVLVMMGGRVWRNPVVNPMFRVASFISIDQPIERLVAVASRAVVRGYSIVVFPEGMRTDGRIRRFHQGAFYLAQQTGADLLPVYLHGTGHVMPKGSGFAARGRVDVEIGQRVSAGSLAAYGETLLSVAHGFHRQYEEHYAEMKRRIEDTHYFHHYIIYKYMYKGIGVERETRRLLKRYDDFSEWIDGFRLPVGQPSATTGQPSATTGQPSATTGQPTDARGTAVSVVNAGRGQFSLLMALVHPELEVFSYTFDADDAALAAACDPLPTNLHVVHAADEATALSLAAGTVIVSHPQNS